MKIKLLHAYKGKPSNYEKLLAGAQDVTSELGEYLVANGHAIALEAPQSETVTEVQTPATVSTVKPKSKR